MYTIVMDHSKRLIKTVEVPIYQGDIDAEFIQFLLPVSYETHNIADCTVLFKYILPSGNGSVLTLQVEPELYKGYLRYFLLFDRNLTAEVGNITISLSVLDSKDTSLFKTGSTYIAVFPKENADDIVNPPGFDTIDQMLVDIEQLQKEKADNITINEETNEIQLEAEGEPIGGKITPNTSSSGGAVWEQF